ncbi:MAG: hypothetical protein HN559_26330 [Gemmatimonadetes bacterium]|jgi:hypothetical protein|nr:hypothetical protein [Gemmatimonadota bacterium]MBT5142139.1 hypothetical protein [Gemmatimonadota bacterium]MBT5589276.1 hypothetical protein [Gemmatimonadota bacterium]MBT5963074.1 hypothetical protein [Gemmatimonadota bacterium]MBT6628579.1 hypothetical protein [Gemmatimonadota bacterium]
MEKASLFRSTCLDTEAKRSLDETGHIVLPGLLTDAACGSLTEALSRIHALMPGDANYPPNHYAAQFDDYLASLIGHPQMLSLARSVLGESIRYDHCFSLNRPGGNGGTNWHSHAYAEEDESLGFIRIFFYVNGFGADDGNLKVVPGSHLFRDPQIQGGTDEDLLEGWMRDRVDPASGRPLTIEALEAEPGSVALLWTHAAHAVNPRQEGSDTRWCVVYGYRNPGADSKARRITPEFENRYEGAEGLLSLY